MPRLIFTFSAIHNMFFKTSIVTRASPRAGPDQLKLHVSIYQAKTGMVSGTHTRVTVVFYGDGEKDMPLMFAALQHEMLRRYHIFLHGVIAIEGVDEGLSAELNSGKKATNSPELACNDTTTVLDDLRRRQHPLLQSRALVVGLGHGQGAHILLKVAEKSPNLFQCVLITLDTKEASLVHEATKVPVCFIKVGQNSTPPEVTRGRKGANDFVAAAATYIYQMYEKWRRESPVDVVEANEDDDVSAERIHANWSFLNEMKRVYRVKARL